MQVPGLPSCILLSTGKFFVCPCGTWFSQNITWLHKRQDIYMHMLSLSLLPATVIAGRHVSFLPSTQGGCIPACNGAGVCVSQHAIGQGVSAQRCVYHTPSPLSGNPLAHKHTHTPPPEQTPPRQTPPAETAT